MVVTLDERIVSRSLIDEIHPPDETSMLEPVQRGVNRGISHARTPPLHEPIDFRGRRMSITGSE
jgi:hypothetical protein